MLGSPHTPCTPLHLSPVEGSPLTLRLALPGQPARPAYEAFVRQRFQAVHGAQVSHFMPQLFGLHDAAERLSAVAGLRLAALEPLFLEHYLDCSIQDKLSQTLAHKVQRASIVEIGNLAADRHSHARIGIICLTYVLSLLVDHDLEWVTFTATPGLFNSFQRLGLDPLPLGPADPLCLGEERRQWGTYYQHQPQLYVGHIPTGYAHLLRMGCFDRYGLTKHRQQVRYAA